MSFSQEGYDIRCAWGQTGLQRLAPQSDVVIIVDVLSFCTCVDIVTARQGVVLPFGYKDQRATEYAAAMDAELASPLRQQTGYSLSPTSLLSITPNTRLVLPSPNGAALSIMTGEVMTIAGCLRNAKAVAEAAQTMGDIISVIPAGERWRPEDTLRVALEDWIGAGAIIQYLEGGKSPEARMAALVFEQSKNALPSFINAIVSGQELIEKGFPQDVSLAAELNVSDTVPVLKDGIYASLADMS